VGPNANGRIPVYGPTIADADVATVVETLTGGWLGMGSNVDQFEQAVLDALGSPARHAVALNTGGAALHVALMVAGVGPGDEVIVPSLCHLSNVQAVLATGAEPVFCDVHDETLTIDPRQAAALAGPRTKAAIALDYGPYLCDYNALEELCGDADLRLVHDAAHAFGSVVDGRPVGSFSDLCVFSFDPVKAFTAIDAGVLIVKSQAEARIAREVRLLGSDQPPEVMYTNARTWDYDATRAGYRYHLSNVHAALGVSQLKNFATVRATRQRACARYADNLKGIDPVWAPQGDFADLCPFMYVIRVPADRRTALRSALSDAGIDTGMHWRPAHRHTYFSQFRHGPLDVTELAAEELVTLPLHSDMSDALVDRVSEAVVTYFR
jgi:dTDP-4-amino-4,6-dideoxygalactose transaminase